MHIVKLSTVLTIVSQYGTVELQYNLTSGNLMQPIDILCDDSPDFPFLL